MFYAYGSKSWLLKRFGKVEEALEYLKKQEKLAIEFDFNEGLGQAIYEQGNIYAFKGQFDKALSLYEKCKKIAEDEKKYNHAQLKQERIMQIMSNTNKANENKEIMDLYSISSYIEVLKVIAKNSNIIFSELLRVVMNSKDLILQMKN